VAKTGAKVALLLKFQRFFRQKLSHARVMIESGGLFEI
jgi:hypothetical protein